MLVDSTNCTVDGVKLTDCMKEEDKVWLESLQDKVSKRGAEIIELKKMSSTFSAAYAICDHIRDWIYGTKDGEWASMGVFPEKDCYGLPEDIVFSLPCILKDHSVEIVKNLELNENSKAKMQDNVNEIVEQLKIGQEVPHFSLKNQNSELVSLEDFQGRKVLIYFYPRASTPGCTVQACHLRDEFKAFEGLNVEILGVSPDSPKKLQNFVQKQQLNFTLLADEDHQPRRRLRRGCEFRQVGYWCHSDGWLVPDGPGQHADRWPQEP